MQVQQVHVGTYLFRANLKIRQIELGTVVLGKAPHAKRAASRSDAVCRAKENPHATDNLTSFPITLAGTPKS